MRALALALTVALAGCSAQNTNISTLQFSGATLPYPDDYQDRAARALDNQVGAEVAIEVSKPKTVVGASVFAPLRWFVCVRGVPDSAPVRTSKPVWGIAEEWLDPASRREELVLFFNATGRPAIRKSAGSPLCNDVEFGTTTLAAMRARGRQ